MDITQGRLKELFNYDPNTGIFTRKVSTCNRVSAGDVVGHLLNNYCSVSINGRQKYLHRLAWIYVHGSIPSGMRIDHVNGDKQDNRLSNLRLSTTAQNMYNSKTRVDNKHGCRGITFIEDLGKWKAYIKYGDKNTTIGYYVNQKDAVEARKKAENLHFGEFQYKLGVERNSTSLKTQQESC